jgi:hypothetical protein
VTVRPIAPPEPTLRPDAVGFLDALVIGVGVMAAGIALMLWWRRRDATFWRQ